MYMPCPDHLLCNLLCNLLNINLCLNIVLDKAGEESFMFNVRGGRGLLRCALVAYRGGVVAVLHVVRER